MQKITLEKYREDIKEARNNWFKPPYELVYDNFVKLGYDKIGKDYFKSHASTVVEELRNSCWNEFQPSEKEFTSEMLRQLIDEDTIKDLSSTDAITWFVEEYPEHIYALTLSNTQSRRSRAGKEFEAIIELILIGAGIPMDSQGNIGKQVFINKGLGKLVDVVSPGVVEFIIDKSDTVLISAKTTLRERWQEVPEEMGRTGAKEMFLATLDENISDEVLDTLYEANIRVTTTKKIKETHYSQNKRVLDFEKLIEICSANTQQWADYDYTIEDNKQIMNMLNAQILKHANHEYVEEYYKQRLEERTS